MRCLCLNTQLSEVRRSEPMCFLQHKLLHKSCDFCGLLLGHFYLELDWDVHILSFHSQRLHQVRRCRPLRSLSQRIYHKCNDICLRALSLESQQLPSLRRGQYLRCLQHGIHSECDIGSRMRSLRLHSKLCEMRHCQSV